MRKLGWVLLGVAAIGGCGSMVMDTSVSTGTGTRVHNIGLLNQQQNLLMASAAIGIIGTIMLVAGNRGDGRIKCPHCGEQISPDARICRFCNREVAEQRPKLEPIARIDPSKVRDDGTLRTPEACIAALQAAGFNVTHEGAGWAIRHRDGGPTHHCQSHTQLAALCRQRIPT